MSQNSIPQTRALQPCFACVVQCHFSSAPCFQNITQEESLLMLSAENGWTASTPKYEIYFYKSENLRRLTLSRRREMRMKLEHKKISKGGGGQLFRGQNIQNLPYASGVGRTYLTARNSFLFEGHLLCPQYPVSSLDDFLSAKSKRYTRYTKRKKCAAPRATMLPTRCPLNSRGARSLPSESGPG